MMTRDNAFRIGENIKIIVSNRPYVDLSIPPESNDYRSVDSSTIKFYDPCGELVEEGEMCEFPTKTGWYFYRFQTNETMRKGGWKVVVTLGNWVPVCGYDPCADTPSTTGTTGTSGTSGSGPANHEWIQTKVINRFSLMDLEIL